ncbi:hypothetical protein L249_1959 [Ophiocordyceps polyrhachis-furcata BCC 54312]|uniref:Uncharacterized protein n=1 Tax=Ophiocordyceps polyrhachis-furcata BCC 54312 TaxID=1330021 RepID=A0A367LND1_9HYPO|nr:hypothetical protein L249_1959 [Ophiocordyceps polyrhachis-furcata BCC 54312]
MLTHILLLSLLHPPPALSGEAAAQQPTSFTTCSDKACYKELSKASGNNPTSLASFCSDSYVTDSSHAERYNLTVDFAPGPDCNDIKLMDTIRPLCDCVANEVNATWNGQEAVKEKEEDDEAPELDPNLNMADFLFEDCRKFPCYSYLDIIFDTPGELKSYCRDPSSSQAPGLDQNSLEEHQCRDLKPACDCIGKASASPSASLKKLCIFFSFSFLKDKVNAC